MYITSPDKFAAEFNKNYPGAYRRITTEDANAMTVCSLICRYSFYSRDDLETVRNILQYEQMRERMSVKEATDYKTDLPSCKICGQLLSMKPEDKCELANVKASDIDWDSYTITIWGKGSKQRKAPFTDRTADLTKEWLSHNGHSNNIWSMTRRGIQSMLNDYKEKTGLPCNAHTFRRTFASNLHRKGIDIEHT